MTYFKRTLDGAAFLAIFLFTWLGIGMLLVIPLVAYSDQTSDMKVVWVFRVVMAFMGIPAYFLSCRFRHNSKSSANRLWQTTSTARGEETQQTWQEQLQPLIGLLNVIVGLIVLAVLSVAAYLVYVVVIALPIAAAIIVGALIIGFAILAAADSSR